MRRTAMTTLLVLFLAACGGATGGDGPAAADATDEAVRCGGVVLDSPDVSTLPLLAGHPIEGDAVATVDDTGTPALDTALPWRVADDGSGGDRAVLIRALDADESAAATGDTHATAEVGPIFGAPNVADGTWLLWSGGTCSLRVAATDRDDQAEVRLAAVPTPDATTLDLLVMERRCASGRSAEGRVELDELTVAVDEVRLRVSVSPPPGDGQTCPSNPWTPFAVELPEPLGDRAVVDANLVPARVLVVGPDEPVDEESAADDRDGAIEQALSFAPWPDYTLWVETHCACSESTGTYEVVVRDGEVVRRRGATSPEDDWLPAGTDPGPIVAPSLGEVLDRLREAYVVDRATVVAIGVDDSGLLLHVEFTPTTPPESDVVAHRFTVDVDSPGDPVRD